MLRTFVIAVGVVVFVSGEAPAAEQLVPLATLKTDIAKFRGKKVDVSGHLSVLGEVATLGADASDARTVLIEFGNLSRDQRQILVAKCSPSCDVRILGKGGLVFRDKGVIATDVRLADAPSKLASAKAD